MILGKNKLLAQALRACKSKACADCLYRGSGIACRARLMQDAADYLEREPAKKSLLTVWGYLDVLKGIYKEKAEAAANRKDATGDKLAADYAGKVAELHSLQKLIDDTTAERE